MREIVQTQGFQKFLFFLLIPLVRLKTSKGIQRRKQEEGSRYSDTIGKTGPRSLRSRYYPGELSYETTGEQPYASASLEIKKLTETKAKPNNSRMKKGTLFLKPCDCLSLTF